MGTESGDGRTVTASSPADSYIGSIISLTSKFEIRYEGVLCFLNPQDSTLGLKSVRSFGTEGRKKDGPQIPPRDEVYEYILFRGKDIKDLQVKSSPPSQVDESIHSDPAIIKSQFASGASSSSKPMTVNGGPAIESSPYQDASAVKPKSYSNSQLLHECNPQFGSWGPTTAQNANYSSHALSADWRAYNITASHNSCAGQQPMTSKTIPVTATPVASPFMFPSTIALINSSNSSAPMSSLAALNSLNSSVMSAFIPSQLSTHPLNSKSLPVMSSLPTYPPMMSEDQFNMVAFPSAGLNATKVESANFLRKNAADMTTVHSAQSLSYAAPPMANSMTRPLLNQSPLLLTPDQLSQPRPSEFHLAQTLGPDHRDMGIVNSDTTFVSSSISTQAAQAPLLPPHASTEQFMEEFDFEAMNEKFNKDEIWGYLGMAKHRDKVERIDGNDNISQLKADGGGVGSIARADSKPAYNKDDFFDTISCNSTSHRVRRQSHHPERMGLDSEQRTHLQYGGYGGGRGLHHPSNLFGWGRGYDSGGRGRRGGYVQW